MNSPFSGRKVLVVEDEMIVAWLLEDMLAELGCAIIGPDAIHKMRRVCIPVPGLDPGAERCAWLHHKRTAQEGRL